MENNQKQQETQNQESNEPKAQKRLKTKGQNKAFARKNVIGRFKGYEINFDVIAQEFDDIHETDEFRGMYDDIQQ